MAEVTHHTIENIFSYHAPTPSQVERYGRIRSKARELAYLLLEDSPGDMTTITCGKEFYELIELIVEDCPESRERTRALGYLKRVEPMEHADVPSPFSTDDLIAWLQTAVMWANASIAINEPGATM